MAADGTITLATRVDTKGIKNGENTVKNAAERMGEKFSKAGQRIQAALNGGTAQADRLTLSMQKASAQVDEQSQKVEGLKAHLAALNSGQEMVTNPEIKGITRDLDAADAKIRQLKAQLATMQAAPSWQQDADKMAQLKSEIDATIKSADVMGERLRNAVDVETQAQIDKTTSTLKKEEIKLDDVKLKAQQAGDALKSSMTGAIPAVNTVTSGIEKFGNRILGLAKRVFVFTLITRALRSVRTFLGNALMSNEDFRNSLNKLKAALLVAFQPIYEVILPALKSLIQWLTNAITTLTKFFAAITGRSYASMVANAKALQEQTDAYKNISSTSSKAAKDMKKTTKEAEKQIAAFDELSILSENKSEDDSDIDTDTDTGSLTSPDFEGLMNDTVSGISDMLKTIMKIAGGALVAIGLVLLFMGNITWGIGFIIAGAAMFAVAEFSDGDFSKEHIVQALAELGEIVGASLMVIGCILLFMGKVRWGIGFIIAGAAIFGVSEAVLSSNNITTTLQEFFQTNGELILGLSLAMLVIGVILLFVPAMMLKGIALIALGLVGIVTEAVMNKDNIMQTITEFFQTNGALIMGISLAMLVIGVILLFVPTVVIGIGVAMIIMGIAGIVAAVAFDDGNSLIEKITGVFSNIHGIIIGLSAALLVIGIIFVMSGLLTPLGIGLIIAGAAGLAAEAVLNWDAMPEKIKEFFENNKAIITGLSAALLVIGIIMCMTGVLTPLGIGLIVAGAAGLVAEATLNFDAIKETITQFFEDNVALILGISGALIVIGVLLLFCGLIPLGVGAIVLGAAGIITEAAINMGAIQETISQFFEENAALIVGVSAAMLVIGILLCFTGVAIPLGIGAIMLGITGIVTEVALNWDVIPDKISEVWETIKTFWDENIAKWFKAETWIELAKNIGEGLLNGIKSGFQKVIDFVESAVQKIKDTISGIGSSISSGVSNLLSGVTGQSGSAAISAFSASVPALASGAVLPANQPFLAMVGDQKSGTNIEAPLETMVEAFQIALASQEQKSSSTTVPLILNGRELGRAVIETGTAEMKRTQGTGYTTKVVY